jgi:hypothetical protein
MPRQDGTVIVEFYGIPRQRAGVAELTVRAGPVAEVLTAIKEACPGLADLTHADGKLSGHYLVSIDGKGFISDPRQPLARGTRLLLLSADAGG